MDSDKNTASRTIKASEFKAACLKLIDEVADTNVEIIITKNGKPVAKLTPYRERPKTLFGIDRGKIQILGDIVSPMPAEWFAVPDEYKDADPLVAPIPPEWYMAPNDTEGETQHNGQ